MIKVLSLLTRKPHLSHEQFVDHWLNILHGPLALSVPGVRRYVQSHIMDRLTRPDIPETAVEVDGIAELWYSGMESFGPRRRVGEMERLNDDGALIIAEIKTFVIEQEADYSAAACWLTASYGPALHLLHVHRLRCAAGGSSPTLRRVQHAGIVQIGVAWFHHVSRD